MFQIVVTACGSVACSAEDCGADCPVCTPEEGEE